MNVANYEMMHRFDAFAFEGVVLDESSILKAYDGKTRNQIIEAFARTPYKLACTATPAPNDHMELGNTSEFLGVMSRAEMLAMFFVHDGGDTAKWRLKGHAENEFWKWVCSWGVMVRKPSDLGFSDAGFELPSLHLHSHVVESFAVDETRLFAVEAQTLTERRQARRESMGGRVEAAAALAALDENPWLLWCDLNAEGEALAAAIPGAVQVTGSDSAEFKEKAMLDFAAGKIRVLISKPSICGFGMNWQHCANVGFVGLSDSYEAFYQAVRRCWRFGQKSAVNCHIFTGDREGAVVANIERKERDAAKMASGMIGHLKAAGFQSVHATARDVMPYQRRTETGENWVAHLGDAVEIMGEMESQSVGYSIFSPPFASLYTYSNSERDMGNCRTHGEFYEHFRFLLDELYRVTQNGRLVSFHCMNLPTSKERDGFIGISDFRGDLIRMFQAAGFIYHSEVVIWKDPVTAMQRTKALGLLHKQIRKDSCMSRQGIPDYLVTMRKPGENSGPVAGMLDDYHGTESQELAAAVARTLASGSRMSPEEARSVNIWQRYASPVWMDINPSDTLQKESAREEKDERHICPLQLEVIRRAIQLWSNPGDVVFSPFGGIGSESYVALEMGRRAKTCELKESYYRQLTANLRRAEIGATQGSLLDLLGAA